jgi:hypothetical protein
MGYGNPRRGSGGGGGATEAVAADMQLQFVRESRQDISTETQLLSIQEDAASAPFADVLIDLQVFDVVYPAGWPSNKTVTIEGKGRNGATISESFAPPAANAGGRVNGVKVFSRGTGIALSNASSPGGEPLEASIQLRNVVAIPTVPAKSFDHVLIGGTLRTVVASNLTQGWVKGDGAAYAQYDSAVVLYTYEPEVIVS